MENHMKDNGLKIKCTEMEYILGQMEENMKDNSKTANNMVLVL